MAPDEISSIFSQRKRWTMGSLQILARNNSLRLPGLTTAQVRSLLSVHNLTITY